MDPFAGEYEFLARHTPPSFEPFSAGTGATRMDQLDDYLRAIDAMPPRPPADVVPTPGCNYETATAPLCGAVDYDTSLLTTFGPYAEIAALDVPAVLPLAPVSGNDADMELHSPDNFDTTQGGHTDPRARAVLVQWMCECSEQYILDDGTVHCTVTQTFGTTLALMPSHAPEQKHRVSIEELAE
jgi:hypothetical protein